jgi:hypothetical protein
MSNRPGLEILCLCPVRYEACSLHQVKSALYTQLRGCEEDDPDLDSVTMTKCSGIKHHCEW